MNLKISLLILAGLFITSASAIVFFPKHTKVVVGHLTAALPFSIPENYSFLPNLTTGNTTNSADKGRNIGTVTKGVGYSCNEESAKQTDGASAGLYLPKEGNGHIYPYDGTNNTSCIDVDFGSTKAAQSILVAYSEPNMVCGDTCEGAYCSTDPGAHVFTSIDRAEWKYVTSLPFSVQQVTKSITLKSAPVRYVRVCRGAGGAARANVLIDSVTLSTPQDTTTAKDTTPPVVSVVTPKTDSVISDPTTVTAEAKDNMGVTGLQFTLDGKNIDSEKTTTPYTISLNPAEITPGQHTLSAVAHDAAGNKNVSTISITTKKKSDTDPSSSGPFSLYMSPTGSDSNNGLSSDTPLKTVPGVLTVLKKQKPTTDVVVHIALGTYVNAGIDNWNFSIPGHSITFLGAGSGEESIPVFTSCTGASDSTCLGGTWFYLSVAKGYETNLIFDHIKVTKYSVAIFLHGNRNLQESGWNGGNIIRNSVFDNIGRAYNRALSSPSYEAVGLMNSRNNQILNNTFRDMHDGKPFHSVYLASYSSGNRISGNRFSRGEGDPIRIRDASNNNTVTDNTFNNIGDYGMVTTWFCKGSCSKDTPECPSTGNIASNNTYTGGYSCNTQTPFTTNAQRENACGISVEQQNITGSNNKRVGGCSLSMDSGQLKSRASQGKNILASAYLAVTDSVKNSWSLFQQAFQH